MNDASEQLAAEKAYQAVAKEMVRKVTLGQVVFRDPPGMVTDLVPATEMLPGSI